MFTSVLIGLLVAVRQLWPLSNLQYVSGQEFKKLQIEFLDYKVVDIRDSSQFSSEPTNGTINISLGRLPYVWQKHITPGEHIFILSQGKFKTKKAARILLKRGFRNLYVIKS
ncbi:MULTISPECIES: rhodanese-like domain-containing protein [Paenibacillus]|uniref:Rhodanese-related sulfurtransferase n=1 Tax=Paenibacillus amylolyticus TaxID=1451 RepID=A0AAP5H3W3_PAEAM|nr:MULTISPECIES: rhodanese-like domain-containing protein [Paenibacillus]MCM3171995.1 rhodanese-like domain-containing protein [Paenibacillus sp. MER 99-2]MDR6724511.1 rhodanese-related sulfurtransferase [Paenibacillus amylolyticus]